MLKAGAVLAFAVATMAAGMASGQTASSVCWYEGDLAAPDCQTNEQGGESAATQSQSISSAIGTQVAARFGAKQDVASQDAGDAASNLTAYWVSAAARSYNGDSAGWQAESVAGIDVYLGDTTLTGAFLGYGKSSRDTNFANDTEIAATVGGLYLAHLFGDSTILHFYLGGGRADYDADGGSAEAKRYMAGIDVSWDIDNGGKMVFVPFGKLLMAADDVPQYVGDSGVHPESMIIGRTMTIGGRVEYKEPLGGTEFLPYLSLGVDFVKISPDNFQPDTDTVAPRAEAGFTGPLWDGLLSLDMHAAKADGGTSDIGGALTYSFGF